MSNNAFDLTFLRKRYRRTRLLFYFFLLLIPIGCGGSMGSCMVTSPQGRKMPAVIVVFGALFMGGLGGVLLMRFDLRRYGRPVELGELAQRLGLSFEIDPPPWHYSDLTPVLRAQGYLVPLLLSGRLEGVPVLALDLALPNDAPGKGQTAVVLPFHAVGVPDFLLRPRTLLIRLHLVLGITRPLELLGQPDFNRRFVLVGPEPEALPARFSAEVVELCLSQPRLTAVVKGGLLALFSARRLAKAQELPGLFEHARKLATALRRPDDPEPLPRDPTPDRPTYAFRRPDEGLRR